MQVPPGIPEDKRVIRIHIGDYVACREPAVISTLLGSCVAVCLFDPVSRIGGMNHILLPGRAVCQPHNEVTRYGVNAMEHLINRIMKLGGDRHRLKAKVFGGANVLPVIRKSYRTGDENARFTIHFLEMEKIPVTAKDLGGIHSRKIFFETDTGDVYLKRVGNHHIGRIVRDEMRRCKSLKKEALKSGPVEFFNTP
jgi:chemotaxis protein CheD